MRNLEALKKTFDVFHEAVYIVNNERKILYFNPVASEISGFRKEDLEGTFCYDNTLNHVDDQGKQLCHEGCPLMDSINYGVNTDHYVYLHHRLGHRVRVHVRSTPIYEDGKIVGAIEAFVDETQKNTLLDELMFHKHMSMIDPLTSLFNRRFLDERFPANLIEVGIEGRLGILFIDIDDFKKINDTYGHQAGDEVLRTVSRSIQYNLKVNDYVVRYGGEEIVVFLKDVDLKLMMQIAEKLRILVEATTVRTSHHQIKQTISVGATLMTHLDSLQDAIDRADQAMYQAKKAGKNCVVRL